MPRSEGRIRVLATLTSCLIVGLGGCRGDARSLQGAAAEEGHPLVGFDADLGVVFSAGRMWLALGLLAAQAAGPVESPRVVRLTHTSARNGQPFWSPDGSRISFVSNRSGSWQVWVMSADGTGQRQVTRHPDPVGWPSWRPGGRGLLFYAGTPERYRLYTVDLDGGEPEVLLEEDGASLFRPSLSPDGRSLLFDRFVPGGGTDYDIYVLDLERGARTRLTTDPGYDSDARWSPDGRQIAFHSDRGRERTHTQVYVMSSAGGEVLRLTDGDAKNSYPSWSPDGERIAFTSETDRGRDVWGVRADGSDPIRLTDRPGRDSEPVWSPDGTRILFVTDRFPGSEELALIEVEPAVRDE